MKTPRRILIDSAFWGRFARTYWEKKPVVFSSIRSSVTDLDEGEVFDLIVSYADFCRKREDASGFKLFIDGVGLHENEVLEFLPRKKDLSLRGYHERMNGIFSDYCLVCDELLQVTREKRSALRDFTEGLYRHVGLPNRFAEMGLYLGNYRRTPFGVHVDGCGVFSFPVAGVKKFRIWDSAFGKKHPDLDRAFEYGKYKKNSKVLTARAGDMVYWPSSAWHIAESDGSFSATWSLGVWVDRTHQEMVVEALQDFFARVLGTVSQKTSTAIRELKTADGEVCLPALYLESLKKLQKASPEEIRKSLLRHWSNHVSKQGLKNKSRMQEGFALKTGTRLRLQDLGSPVLWSRNEIDSEISFSFAGTSVVVAKPARILKLIKALNAGGICRIGDFLSDRRELKSLQLLADAGAFGRA